MPSQPNKFLFFVNLDSGDTMEGHFDVTATPYLTPESVEDAARCLLALAEKLRALPQESRTWSALSLDIHLLDGTESLNASTESQVISLTPRET